LLKAGAVTAVKVAAEAITAEKIAALTITAGKIAANAVTSEKINALAVTAGKIAAEAITTEKLAANSVTAAKIVAGTITAEKLSVATLSAISANLGTVTAGTLEAVVIKAAKIEDSKLIFEVNSEIVPVGGEIQWIKEGAEEIGKIRAYRLAAVNTLEMLVKNKAKSVAISLAGPTGTETGSVKVSVNAESLTVLESTGISSFLQLPAPAKRVINRGKSLLEWPGGSTFTKVLEIEHGLGATPIAVCATAQTANMSVATGTFTATKFSAQITTVEGFNPAAGSKENITWIAMT
jgi:hypothetical protein